MFKSYFYLLRSFVMETFDFLTIIRLIYDYAIQKQNMVS